MDERSIFMAALEEETPAGRSAYLDEACGGDAALRRRVEALLASHEQAGSFLGRPVPERLAGQPAETSAEAPPAEGLGGRIGPYKLLQEVGEGGMGTVWMAQQTEPVKRMVALKVIKPGMDSKQVLARFEAERQALALMDHPNIARVFDAATTETGRPYFVMELVKGVSITRYCDEHRLTPRQRLELFVPVCQAIQHAHQKGVIHRDIKPSNVLVCQYDGRPVPKVIDFGIAKATGQQLTEMTLATGLGNVVGTLEYMSPEQAELNQLDIDTRSDVYSLGVLLYELLTGSTPLDKKRLKQAAMLEVLRLIRDDEPPRPSTRLSTGDGMPSVAANRGLEPKRLSGLVRGELDWIVMKALEKDRGRRYETANGFAADVQRYLADEPVQACPPSVAYRLRKMVRRNKVALATVGLVALALVLGAGVSVWQAIRAWKAEGVAETERETAVEEKEAAEEARGKALAEERKAGEARGLAERQRDRAEWLAYTGQVGLANAEWQYGGNAALVRHHLDRCQKNLRGWEYDYLASLLEKTPTLEGHVDRVFLVEFSPDGKRLTSISRNAGVSYEMKGWDADKRTEILGARVSFRTVVGAQPAISADGKFLVVILEDRTLSVRDLPRGHEFLAIKGYKARVSCVRITPDSKRVVAGFDDGTLAVWDVDRRCETLALEGYPSKVLTLAISPDGKRIASGSLDGTVKVWDAVRGRELFSLGEKPYPVLALEYSPDGKTIVSTSRVDGDSNVIVWDAERGGPPLNRAPIRDPYPFVSFCEGGKRIVSGGIQCVTVWDVEKRKQTLRLARPFTFHACSPDGRRFVTSFNGGTLTVWDAEGGRELFTLKGHKGAIRWATFSPDGKRIATGSQDTTVKVWDAARGVELFTCKGHTADVWCVAFSPDGKRLASGSHDKTVKIWDGEQGDEAMALEGVTGEVRSVAISPDGKRIAASIKNEWVKVWNAEGGREIFSIRLPGYPSLYGCVAFSPDGKRLAGGWGDMVKVWDAETGRETLSKGLQGKGPQREVCFVTYSPDGKRLAGVSRGGTLKVWDAQTGRETLSDTDKGVSPQSLARRVAFSPDGRLIVTTSSGTAVKVWDAERGRGILALEGHTSPATSVAFSPDGKRIVSGGCDKTVRVWDAERGKSIFTLEGHTNIIYLMLFSPDGKRIVTGSHDKTIRVWDAERGSGILTLEGQSSSISSVAISPDGKRIVSADYDGTIKVWDTAWGSETLTMKGHAAQVASVLFSPDGKRIVSGSSDRTVKIWAAGRRVGP